MPKGLHGISDRVKTLSLRFQTVWNLKPFAYRVLSTALRVEG